MLTQSFIIMEIVAKIKQIDDNPKDGKFYLPTQIAERHGLMFALSLLEPNINDAKELFKYLK
jgi:hypothetical protein